MKIENGKNVIICTLEIVVGTDKIDYISGIIKEVGTTECSLSEERGSVYGIAVLLKNEEKKDVFDKIRSKQKASHNIDDWKPISGNYYPLYWGKDINMGARLYSHTRTMKSTGTIQLNSLECLKDKTVIYGAIPCINYEENEKKIIDRYPCLLKTIKGKSNQITAKEFSVHENHS